MTGADTPGFATAMASPGQPDPACAALHALAEAAVGVRLFTLMTFDAETRLARRIWSSDPDAYPAGGTKPVEPGPWPERVLDGRLPFVANTIEEIAAVFSDHALIASLGCESCLNLPIVADDTVLGTLNLLHEAGWYTPERVARAGEALTVPGALCLLLAARAEGRA